MITYAIPVILSANSAMVQMIISAYLVLQENSYHQMEHAPIIASQESILQTELVSFVINLVKHAHLLMSAPVVMTEFWTMEFVDRFAFMEGSVTIKFVTIVALLEPLVKGILVLLAQKKLPFMTLSLRFVDSAHKTNLT